MTAKELREAMSPIARITKQAAHLPELRRGGLYEVVDGDDDLYAVADQADVRNGKYLWISMVIVPCVPANPAAIDLWLTMGWKVPS